MHYMLSATARLPDVVSLIRKMQYFVVHAQRQCGKTTALLALRNEINAGCERVAMYCSLEAAEGVADPEKGIPIVYSLIQNAASQAASIANCPARSVAPSSIDPATMAANGVSGLLSELSKFAGKPLVVFFDEVDCLCDATLVAFLRQLRDGAISKTKGVDFPASIALVGMRNIRDYKAKIRPDHESLGSASPFNVLTEAMTLRIFTDEEVAALYEQHTADTGQAFEPDAVRLAYEYTCGQPYLVNALARWCVEKIHHDDYSVPVTAADMHEAKEKIIRENPIHLDYLYYMVSSEWVKPIVDAGLRGMLTVEQREDIRFEFLMSLEFFCEVNGKFEFANPIYATYWRSRIAAE